MIGQSSQRLGRQPDLFAPAADVCDSRWGSDQEPPPADFIDRICGDLQHDLSLVTGSAELPWTDPTKALLTEMRFHSIAEWMPAEEASRLRTAFAAELDRIYGTKAND